ncbi:hypothetical protein SAMN06265795_114122 [Noviherbaspirillum humi]|uniref:Uncharacterized protein n=1 Tax=Noviherbaspirillum humi TaxID=1688639 RepID=A0A239K3V8_9BURK|nr:hypothetical protein SAMN06265795_114122 [Noviherbaspirillum humi]
MARNRKMATSDRLLGLTRECPECGRQIQSNGQMYFDFVTHDWYIGFWCPVEKEVSSCWRPEYQPLIDEVSNGLEFDSLPDEPAHVT